MFKAQFASKCANCGNVVKPGQFIKRVGVKFSDYAHADCRTYADFELVREIEAAEQYEEWCAEQYIVSQPCTSPHTHSSAWCSGPAVTPEMWEQERFDKAASYFDGVEQDIYWSNYFAEEERRQEAAAFMAGLE